MGTDKIYETSQATFTYAGGYASAEPRRFPRSRLPLLPYPSWCGPAPGAYPYQSTVHEVLAENPAGSAVKRPQRDRRTWLMQQL